MNHIKGIPIATEGMIPEAAMSHEPWQCLAAAA